MSSFSNEIKSQTGNLFKWNKDTNVWSRVLLKSDGKKIPYQNELILTPPSSPVNGYPMSWPKVEELWVVKFFHQVQPKKVVYFDEAPAWLVELISQSVSRQMTEILLHADLTDRLIHTHLPSAIPVKGKRCITDYDELIGMEVEDAQPQ